MRNRMLLVRCLGLAHAITMDELALSYDGRMSSTSMSGVNFAGAGFSVRGRGTQIGFQPENPRRLFPDTWQRKLSEKFGLLSVGGFGKVYAAEAKCDSTARFAVKLLESKEVGNATVWKNEVLLMWKFRTPQFVHILDDGPTYDVGDDGVMRKSIIMEMANGDLGQFTNGRLRADWTQALQFLHDMLKGLSYLHEKRVVHRDLKPGNVLFVCPDGLMEKMKHSPGTGSAGPPEEICHAKIADLGLACNLGDDSSYGEKCVEGDISGSKRYYAPELLKYRRISTKNDVWGIGLIFFKLVFQRLPFGLENASTKRGDDNYITPIIKAILPTDVDKEVDGDAMMRKLGDPPSNVKRSLEQASRTPAEELAKLVRGMLQPKDQERMDATSALSLLGTLHTPGLMEVKSGSLPRCFSCASADNFESTIAIKLHKREKSDMVGVKFDDEYSGEGFRLRDMPPDGLAVKSGLRDCDVVESINGATSSSLSKKDAAAAIRESVGDILLLVRKEKCASAEYSNGITTINLRKTEKNTSLGVTFFKESIGEGVRLQKVVPDGIAMQAGLNVCDLVFSMNGEDVPLPMDVAAVLRKSVGDISLTVRKAICASVEYSDSITTIKLLKKQTSAPVGLVFFQGTSERVRLKKVEPNSLAMNAGLHDCDWVVSINGKEMSSAADAAAMVRESVGDISLSVRKGYALQ